MGTLSLPAVLLLVVMGGALLHGVSLLWTVFREQPEVDRCARALAEAQPGQGSDWVWRFIPDDCDEPKLVLGYDRECRHQIMQYPVLRDAQHVRFAGGRVHLMSQDAIQRTLEADDALRERLDLEPAGEREG